MSIETTKQAMIDLMHTYTGNYDWSAIKFDCFDLAQARSDIHAEIEVSSDNANGEPITRNKWHLTRYLITIHPSIVPSTQRGVKSLSNKAYSDIMEDLSHIFFDTIAGVVNQLSIKYISSTKTMIQTNITHRPCKIVTEWEVLHQV
jgi:hypothetical protein